MEDTEYSYSVRSDLLYIPCMQENNFQVVVATNGVQSYTVFTYQCGKLNWVQGSTGSIGFSASSMLFANHPLSRQSNVNDIACLNQQCPPWTNVVYQISRELGSTIEYRTTHRTLTKYLYSLYNALMRIVI